MSTPGFSNGRYYKGYFIQEKLIQVPVPQSPTPPPPSNYYQQQLSGQQNTLSGLNQQLAAQGSLSQQQISSQDQSYNLTTSAGALCTINSQMPYYYISPSYIYHTYSTELKYILNLEDSAPQFDTLDDVYKYVENLRFHHKLEDIVNS